jgi:outer membrane protein assembly factor BamA
MMRLDLKWYLLVLIGSVFYYTDLSAQASDLDSVQVEQKDFIAFYPLLFYFPETRLGLGAAGVYNYYPGIPKSKRPSQWQVGAAYTLNKQILLYASYQYFLKENQYELFGELGYYDYFYFYYGIGNDTRLSQEETYFVRFPRFQFNGLKRIFPKWRAGLSYKFDDYNIYQLESAGSLELNQTTGFEGGIISNIGAIIRYDTRDNINLPKKGTLLTISLEHNAEWLGSHFNFNRLLVDYSHYFPIKEGSVFAINAYQGMIEGSAPFQELLFMGGPKKARGLVAGQYRDTHLALLQGAFRFPLFWRFRATVFTSIGRVANEYSDLWRPDFHLNYGTGIRFLLDEKEGIQFRFDVGFGGGVPRYYLTIGEAF